MFMTRLNYWLFLINSLIVQVLVFIDPLDFVVALLHCSQIIAITLVSLMSSKSIKTKAETAKKKRNQVVINQNDPLTDR